MNEDNTTSETPEKQSIFGKLKSGWRSMAEATTKTGKSLYEKGTRAKDSVSERFTRFDADECTLEEALAEIEAAVFGSTTILEDLDDRFVGSARKIRDQVARTTAKLIYDRWKDEAEKEKLKTLMELDYSDV